MEIQPGLTIKNNQENNYIVFTYQKGDKYHLVEFVGKKDFPVFLGYDFEGLMGMDYSLEEIKDNFIFNNWRTINDKEFNKFKKYINKANIKKLFPFVGGLERIGLGGGSEKLHNKIKVGNRF